jgi:signal transduction histidine kinase
LTVERGQEQSLSHEDLDLMSTVASQLGVALDNAEAYRRIEELNVGLEERIRERTKELLRANEELGAANAQLQTVDKQKDLFLMTVSHDLRNPLGAIKGFAENVLHGIAATPEKQAYYLTRIRDNADRLGRMIKLLLNVAEIKAGRMEMTFADVELSILVNEVVEQLSDLARLKEQQVLVHPPERPVIVQADVDKLTQVLCNLVENGIKYTPRHGTISIYVGATDQHASVHVADTGEGIPASELPKIFDPFYQVARRAEGRQHGIGLGLWIVKQLAELQSGTITVTSEVGKGTEFVVRLPLIEGR